MQAKTVVFEPFGFSCLGHLGEFLDGEGIRYERRLYAEVDSSVHTQLRDVERMILLGSPESVNDKEKAWIPEIQKLIGHHIAAGTFVVGICFGAQLIASTLGSQVVSLRDPRIGFRPIGDRSVHPYAGNWLCFHEEHCTLAAGMDRVLKDHDTIYAFHSRNAVGLQFHPEMDLPTIERIADTLPKDHPYLRQLRATAESFDPTAKERAFALFGEMFYTKRLC
jgi:GMP synthase (glutamine-hydrolysing)